MNVSYPYVIDQLGKTGLADDDKHIRDLIEQVLFTAPGERVMRPDFGSGVYQLIFAPAHDSLVAAAQQTIQAALQRWLGDLILVDSVSVETSDSLVSIEVSYKSLSTNEMTTSTFERSL
ncbi:MAG: GPW/gp25 family protein [Desulfobacterales bacterium]|nr:GPW/gp25 family protein [Desulfobacterales bacterium]